MSPCQSFPEILFTLQQESFKSRIHKIFDKLFLTGKKPNFSPFFYLSLLSIHLYVPLHFPFSFLIILILSVPPYLTFILTIFLTLTPSSFPLPASLFPSFLQPSFSPRLSPALTHFPATFLSLLLSPLSFSPSQMSDHSLVFRLPCHHIFHTAPSLNWACIIISYHVEYVITARDERWPPPIPS